MPTFFNSTNLFLSVRNISNGCAVRENNIFSLPVSKVRLVCGDTGGRLGAFSRATIPSGDTIEEAVINNNNIPHLG